MKHLAAAPFILAGFGMGLLFAPSPAGAQAADRWLADEVEASAALPLPRGDAAVTGAAMSCAAQRWTLRLEFEGDTVPAGGAATMVVDGRSFALDMAVEGGGLAASVPREAIEPLKDGLRLAVGLSGADTADELAFPLRGSRIAISAAQERCSLRDMSAYRPVTLTPYSSYINLARRLRADDIDAFALSTASQPEVSVAMTELGEGRRLLFTRLCGSSWYYGLSGCNITGFAPDANAQARDDDEDVAEGPQWRAVYDTENVLLHLDPKSFSHGWPDLVTLPVRAAGAGLIWRWDGRAYALKGELPEEEEEADTLRLRSGLD